MNISFDFLVDVNQAICISLVVENNIYVIKIKYDINIYSFMNLIFISDEVLGSRAPGLKSGYNTQVCKGFLQSLKQLGKANNQNLSAVRMSILFKGNYQLVKKNLGSFQQIFRPEKTSSYFGKTNNSNSSGAL